MKVSVAVMRGFQQFCQRMQPKLIFSLVVAFFLLPILTHSQQKIDSIDFSHTDSVSKKTRYKNDITKLTKDLTDSYSQDIYKVRAIFTWITNNIKYDYQFINKGKEIKGPDCDGLIDCTHKTNEWENNYLKKILKTKKAVSDGYTRLFKKMCEIVAINVRSLQVIQKQNPTRLAHHLA